MLIEEELDSLILPILRLDSDPVKGFEREPTTIKLFQARRYEYCCALFSDLWLRDALKIIDVYLPDIGNDIYAFHALVPKGAAASAFAESCRIIAHNRRADPRSRERDDWGYDIPPAGITSMIGYFSPTRAWLVLHPRGPALLMRAGDDIDDDLNRWLEYWSEAPRLYKKWPDKEDGLELIVPQGMIDLSTLAMQQRRRRKPMPKSVQRFLFRGS